MTNPTRKLILMDGDRVIAESSDPQLWQWVATTIRQQGGQLLDPAPGEGSIVNPDRFDPAPGEGSIVNPDLFAQAAAIAAAGTPAELVEKLGKELILPVDTIIQACAPSLQPPYLKLNFANWQIFRELVAHRPGLSPLVLALSLLLLWSEQAAIGAVTIAAGQAVLATVGDSARYPDQDVAACGWLDLVDHRVSFTPGQSGKAVVLARAFCLKKKPAL